MGRNILKNLKLILVAKTIGLDIIACQVMPIILKTAVRIVRRNDTPYMGVHFVVISNSRYYVYADNLFRILISGYSSRIYI